MVVLFKILIRITSTTFPETIRNWTFMIRLLLDINAV